MTDEFITLTQAAVMFDIPKRSLSWAAQREWLKTEWREFPMHHQVTTRAWVEKWKNTPEYHQRLKKGQKITRKKATIEGGK